MTRAHCMDGQTPLGRTCGWSSCTPPSSQRHVSPPCSSFLSQVRALSSGMRGGTTHIRTRIADAGCVVLHFHRVSSRQTRPCNRAVCVPFRRVYNPVSSPPVHTAYVWPVVRVVSVPFLSHFLSHLISPHFIPLPPHLFYFTRRN